MAYEIIVGYTLVWHNKDEVLWMKPEQANIAHTNFSQHVSTYSAPSNTSLWFFHVV